MYFFHSLTSLGMADRQSSKFEKKSLLWWFMLQKSFFLNLKLLLLAIYVPIDLEKKLLDIKSPEGWILEM